MRGMANKKQLGARIDAEIAALARKRAADRGLSVGDYLAQLVLADATGLRERARGAAERFLAEHQQLFDDAEDTQREPTASDGRGAHAA